MNEGFKGFDKNKVKVENSSLLPRVMTKQTKARILLMENNSFNTEGLNTMSPTNWFASMNSQNKDKTAG